MSQVAVIVTIEVAPSRRDELLPLLMAHRARSLKDEVGITQQFEVLVPGDADTKALTCEVYRDEAAFEQHRNGRSIAQFREDTAGMIVKMQVTKCFVQAG
jgi:(4S)-4-hydroxy-5-phosphonooxypentane-2,3-dione isomerase